MYFCHSENYGVTSMQAARFPFTTVLQSLIRSVSPACWENEWNRIRGTAGLEIQDRSEAKDYQIPRRGRLYLLEVRDAGKSNVVLKTSFPSGEAL